MCRFIENIINRTLLYDLTCIHNGYFITDISHDTQVMGDENDTHLGFLLQILHQLQDLCLDSHIQSRSRLVSDQKLWMTDQSHSDHNTLSHTTGELMWILLHTFLHVVDAYHFHHLHGAFLRVLLGNALIVGS